MVANVARPRGRTRIDHILVRVRPVPSGLSRSGHAAEAVTPAPSAPVACRTYLALNWFRVPGEPVKGHRSTL
ncbi:hypothetical protein GCM10017556_49100 [Micromonospora sagamiensis]|nr:hypothetical protein GCM10017556_49100 [Micromonospora sagamiensis]